MPSSADEHAERQDKFIIEPGHVSYSPFVSREDGLPMAFVRYPQLYGALVRYAPAADGPWHLCTCTRDALSAWLDRYRVQKTQMEASGGRMCSKPEAAYLWERNVNLPVEDDLFVEGACHLCNRSPPRANWCVPMYGGPFKRTWGWWVMQWALLRMEDRSAFKDNGAEREAENDLRVHLGMPRIGEGFVGEMLLLRTVEAMFPGEEVVHHFRPGWLKPQEIDVAVPTRRLAFEYQGQQHYEPIEVWGGASGLKRRRTLDERKRELCAANGYVLVEIRYDEHVSQHDVLRMIEEARG